MTGNSLKFALILFASLPAACAQSTWHNLRFGMSKNEVTSVLAPYKLTPGEDGSLVSRVDYQLRTSATTPFPFRISALFDSNSRLQRIDLSLDVDALIAKKDFDSPDSGVGVVNTFLFKDLAGKYGAATRETGECADPVESYGRGRIGTCSKFWTEKGQEIELFWAVGGTSQRMLFLAYKKANSDL